MVIIVRKRQPGKWPAFVGEEREEVPAQAEVEQAKMQQGTAILLVQHDLRLFFLQPFSTKKWRKDSCIKASRSHILTTIMCVCIYIYIYIYIYIHTHTHIHTHTNI
jgi:hypothetical protein